MDDCQENVQENVLDNALGFTDLASGEYSTFKKILSVLILSEYKHAIDTLFIFAGIVKHHAYRDLTHKNGVISSIIKIC